AITLAVMTALLLVISARLVDLVRTDEKALTEVEATGLAEHFAQMPSLPDATELERPTELIRTTRRDVVALRVWEVADNRFNIKWSTAGNTATSEMSSAVAATLRDNRVARIESGRAIETHESLYRVFAPIVRGTKVVGAVEISHHLDNLPSILK